jgi:hypothetical protein
VPVERREPVRSIGNALKISAVDIERHHTSKK